MEFWYASIAFLHGSVILRRYKLDFIFWSYKKIIRYTYQTDPYLDGLWRRSSFRESLMRCDEVRLKASTSSLDQERFNKWISSRPSSILFSFNSTFALQKPKFYDANVYNLFSFSSPSQSHNWVIACLQFTFVEARISTVSVDTLTWLCRTNAV